MPDNSESAEIVVGGETFSEWETVRIEIDFAQAARRFVFSVAEADDRTIRQWTALRIKPGDEASIYLAGQLVCKGYVYQRQAAYAADSHGVMLAGLSKVGDIVHSSMPLKNAQFRGYAFDAIARAALAPYSVDLKMSNPPSGWNKPFKDVNIIPGDTVFSFLERIGRQRGLFLFDDKDGNLNAGGMSGDPVLAELQEGRNIETANCLIEDTTIFSRLDVVSQQRGDDNTDGQTARKPAAFATNDSAPRFRYRLVAAEEPGDAQDMKQRADHEMNQYLGDVIEAQVTVQGWFSSGGELWAESLGKRVHVLSPMLLLDHDLFVQSIILSQDPSGTKTTLSLRRQPLGGVDRTDTNPTGGVLPGGNPQGATPDA